MNNNNERNGNNVLLTVIGVATLLVALVGATFAYFTATVSNDQAQSVSVTTASPVALEYEGQQLTLENAIPGNTDNKTFTVENPMSSTTTQTYDLKLIVDENSFTSTQNANQLKIDLSGNSNASNKPSVEQASIDVTDGTSAAAAEQSFDIVNDQKIAPNETHTYTLTLTFAELNQEQNENANGKTFKAHVEISDPKSAQSE